MNTIQSTVQPIALITGASSGIGREFALQLAQQGYSLILVARQQKELDEVALQCQHLGSKCHTIAMDLTITSNYQHLFTTLKEMNFLPTLVINNAGFATYGILHATALDRLHDEVQLNCQAVMALNHLFLADMVSKKHGGIINVASTAAFQPDPYMAVYGATKAFVLSLSEALWAEYRPYGITVMALCPGATNTNFFNVVNAQEASVGNRMPVDQVVTSALKAFKQRKSFVVTGLGNRILGQLYRLLPRHWILRIVESMLRPKS